jgi:CheY-like chemotaxis protein
MTNDDDMAEATRPSKLILVVEDDAELGDIIGEVLATAGYKVDLARNGQEALDRLRVHAPGLVLLDLMMPVMNGWEFRAAQLRDPSLAAIPVVTFSGDGSIDEKAAALGAVGSLRKPVSLADLMKLIRRICGPPHDDARQGN